MKRFLFVIATVIAAAAIGCEASVEELGPAEGSTATEMPAEDLDAEDEAYLQRAQQAGGQADPGTVPDEYRQKQGQ